MRLLAVKQGFDATMLLEGDGQAEFHRCAIYSSALFCIRFDFDIAKLVKLLYAIYDFLKMLSF